VTFTSIFEEPSSALLGHHGRDEIGCAHCVEEELVGHDVELGLILALHVRGAGEPHETRQRCLGDLVRDHARCE